jgi:hypothetical protein
VVARGERLVRDVSAAAPAEPSKLQDTVTGFFRRSFPLNRDDSRLGWQMVAVAHVPARPATGR